MIGNLCPPRLNEFSFCNLTRPPPPGLLVTLERKFFLIKIYPSVPKEFITGIGDLDVKGTMSQDKIRLLYVSTVIFEMQILISYCCFPVLTVACMSAYAALLGDTCTVGL